MNYSKTTSDITAFDHLQLSLISVHKKSLGITGHTVYVYMHNFVRNDAITLASLSFTLFGYLRYVAQLVSDIFPQQIQFS